MAKEPVGIELAVNVVLDESHPLFREHAGYLTQRIGEALLREVDETGERQEFSRRQEFAERLGLPRDKPFRLTVRAVNRGAGAR